jgi:selenocysteine-specific elongation factor
VIGTAGHVDHGKTTLVKALTGTDTDRWPEEKRRGITIDLGFAAVDLPGGLRASVVDVPGHEDFVRNMVAGATGVDVALLVVAADEGIMPQTLEHLAILEFLAVESGVVALTKADSVDPEWVELVAADITERLARSSIRWEGPVPVSGTLGTGLDQLRESLAQAARLTRTRSAEDLFRMPVDRVFTVAGAGTVVTGTTWSGAVSVGAEVILLPAGVWARVRSVEVHGEARDRAEPGRRTALALAGLDRENAARGTVVVADASWRAGSTMDVIITLLPGVRPLTQRTPLKVHLGTAEVMARVTPLSSSIPPGRPSPARLRLAAPAVARWGDRGVLRSGSPVTTIGGCVVVDPWPPARPRRPVAAVERGEGNVVSRIRAFVGAEDEKSSGLPVADLPVRLGLHPAELGQAMEALLGLDVLRVGDRLVSRGTGLGRREAGRQALEAFHATHPMEPGMPLERWRKGLGGSSLARKIEEDLVAEGVAVTEGAFIRLARHRAAVPDALLGVSQAVRSSLSAAGREGRTPEELSSLGTVAEVQQLLEHLVREGTAVRVGKDRYYAQDELKRLTQQALREISRRGAATPSELRDALGLTRKYLIPFLEWLDSAGLTVRAGDSRRLGPAAHLEGSGLA